MAIVSFLKLLVDLRRGSSTADRECHFGLGLQGYVELLKILSSQKYAQLSF